MYFNLILKNCTIMKIGCIIMPINLGFGDLGLGIKLKSEDLKPNT